MKKEIIFYLFITVLFIGCGEKTSSPDIEKKSETKTNNIQDETTLTMGYFEYTVDDKIDKIKAFEDGYNDITISENLVVVRVKDLNGVNFLITMQGKGIADNLVHTYVPIAPGLKKEDFQAVISVVGLEEDDILNPFRWKSGELTIFEYNAKDGTLKGEFGGKGGKTRDIKNENPVTFTGDIDMKFTTVADYSEE
jgi:hypothetical protein